jgi:methionyl-tRNA formyltransferase
LAVHERPLTAVFFLHLSVSVLPMIRAWLEAGHRAGAVVVYGQRWPALIEAPLQWIALRWIVMRYLHRNGIPVIQLSGAPDWHQLRLDLSQHRPDVAISYGFMRLLPESVLSLFLAGGLNFHPALLPYYRGPKPLHWLALSNDWEAHGGVTLHEMSDAFDEGAIVAQAAMSDPSDTEDVTYFVSNAITCITRRVIPGYCAGDVVAWPQPAGVYPYASLEVPGRGNT